MRKSQPGPLGEDEVRGSRQPCEPAGLSPGSPPAGSLPLGRGGSGDSAGTSRGPPGGGRAAIASAGRAPVAGHLRAGRRRCRRGARGARAGRASAAEGRRIRRGSLAGPGGRGDGAQPHVWRRSGSPPALPPLFVPNEHLPAPPREPQKFGAPQPQPRHPRKAPPPRPRRLAVLEAVVALAEAAVEGPASSRRPPSSPRWRSPSGRPARCPGRRPSVCRHKPRGLLQQGPLARPSCGTSSSSVRSSRWPRWSSRWPRWARWAALGAVLFVAEQAAPPGGWARRMTLGGAGARGFEFSQRGYVPRNDCRIRRDGLIVAGVPVGVALRAAAYMCEESACNSILRKPEGDAHENIFTGTLYPKAGLFGGRDPRCGKGGQLLASTAHASTVEACAVL